MPAIDTTIRLSDVLTFAVLAVGVFKLLISQRDHNRDISALLKGSDGRPGVVGDVSALKHDMYESGGLIHIEKNKRQALEIALGMQGIATTRDSAERMRGSGRIGPAGV